ncbi:hypothetical protein WS73_05620 [Burkholderia savannae]|nr:hypothetical protein WS73_05620 [Burkholderia savannae]
MPPCAGIATAARGDLAARLVFPDSAGTRGAMATKRATVPAARPPDACDGFPDNGAPGERRAHGIVLRRPGADRGFVGTRARATACVTASGARAARASMRLPPDRPTVRPPARLSDCPTAPTAPTD